MSRTGLRERDGKGVAMVLLVGLGAICVVWAVVAAILISADLHRRGMAVSVVWLRLMILEYLHEYSKVTREETGRVGPLFYHYVVPLNVALVVVAVLAIRALV
jgi:hypothetical protein